MLAHYQRPKAWAGAGPEWFFGNPMAAGEPAPIHGIFSGSGVGLRVSESAQNRIFSAAASKVWAKTPGAGSGDHAENALEMHPEPNSRVKPKPGDVLDFSRNVGHSEPQRAVACSCGRSAGRGRRVLRLAIRAPHAGLATGRIRLHQSRRLRDLSCRYLRILPSYRNGTISLPTCSREHAGGL